MTYFISDLHFGHTNILSLCERPFASIEAMDRALIDNWNRRVKANDTVYLLGDVVWDKRRVPYYMEQLAGRKILVAGNHDDSWVRREECRAYFEEVRPYLEVHLNGHPVTMCHYPMLEWRSSRELLPRKLGYHIHGHIHNRIGAEYRALFLQFNALNAGADVNDFTPVSFDTLLANNLAFKLAALTSEEDRATLRAAYERYAPTKM